MKDRQTFKTTNKTVNMAELFVEAKSRFFPFKKYNKQD